MTHLRKRKARTARTPVDKSATEVRNQEESHDNAQQSTVSDTGIEQAATKAKLVHLDTSIEELKSRISGLESHVGTQLQQIHQSLLKFVVIPPSTSADEQRQPTPSSRVLELILSPKGALKKVMRQSIRQYMFSNSGGIFANSSREHLGRKTID